ncbi:MAG: cyclic nucleotide-binding domain-containing protein [Acetobacteraceae bacterium]|nr:cyclic nucleotide-binding domain-containing protein [Acetobacteraceae bacterium]
MISDNHFANRFISSIPQDDYELLAPFFRFSELIKRTVIIEGGDQIEQVYSPHNGILSLVVVLQSGAAVEVAMVGSDGLFGALSALDGKISLNTAVVQIGGTGSVISTTDLRAVAAKSENFRGLLMRHEQVIFAQALRPPAPDPNH